jgi:predicted MPP superfamily phosphohydrolase
MAYTPFVFASDVHGDCQDTAACNALFRFMRDWKPKIRVCGGDVWDFRAWRNGASPKELDEDGEADVTAGFSFLDQFRPTHLLCGNHDFRVFDKAKTAKDGRVRALAQRIVKQIEDHATAGRYQVLPYHKRHGVLRIGHLKMLHGFGGGGMNCVREHARNYGSCLIGHVHSIDEASLPGLDRRVCRSVGALCQLDMDYSAHSPGTLRHSNGWAYGVVDEKTGDYAVFQAENVNGKYVVAGGTQVISA